MNWDSVKAVSNTKISLLHTLLSTLLKDCLPYCWPSPLLTNSTRIPSRLQSLGSFHGIVTEAATLRSGELLVLLNVLSQSAEVAGIARASKAYR